MWQVGGNCSDESQCLPSSASHNDFNWLWVGWLCSRQVVSQHLFVGRHGPAIGSGQSGGWVLAAEALALNLSCRFNGELGNRQHHPSSIHPPWRRTCDLREGTHQGVVIERRFSQSGDNQTCGCRIARHGHIHLDSGKGIDGDWFLSNYTKRYGCWWRCVFPGHLEA